MFQINWINWVFWEWLARSREQGRNSLFVDRWRWAKKREIQESEVFGQEKGKDVDCWKIRGVERIKMKSMRCEKTKVLMVMEWVGDAETQSVDQSMRKESMKTRISEKAGDADEVATVMSGSDKGRRHRARATAKLVSWELLCCVEAAGIVQGTMGTEGTVRRSDARKRIFCSVCAMKSVNGRAEADGLCRWDRDEGGVMVFTFQPRRVEWFTHKPLSEDAPNDVLLVFFHRIIFCDCSFFLLVWIVLSGSCSMMGRIEIRCWWWRRKSKNRWRIKYKVLLTD